MTVARVEVAKTLKLYINGAFPRSESGRTIAVKDAKGRVVEGASVGTKGKELLFALCSRKFAHLVGSATVLLFPRVDVFLMNAKLNFTCRRTGPCRFQRP